MDSTQSQGWNRGDSKFYLSIGYCLPVSQWTEGGRPLMAEDHPLTNINRRDVRPTGAWRLDQAPSHYPPATGSRHYDGWPLGTSQLLSTAAPAGTGNGSTPASSPLIQWGLAGGCVGGWVGRGVCELVGGLGGLVAGSSFEFHFQIPCFPSLFPV